MTDVMRQGRPIDSRSAQPCPHPCAGTTMVTDTRSVTQPTRTITVLEPCSAIKAIHQSLLGINVEKIINFQLFQDQGAAGTDAPARGRPAGSTGGTALSAPMGKASADQRPFASSKTEKELGNYDPCQEGIFLDIWKMCKMTLNLTIGVKGLGKSWVEVDLGRITKWVVCDFRNLHFVGRGKLGDMGCNSMTYRIKVGSQEM